MRSKVSTLLLVSIVSVFPAFESQADDCTIHYGELLEEYRVCYYEEPSCSLDRLIYLSRRYQTCTGERRSDYLTRAVDYECDSLNRLGRAQECIDIAEAYLKGDGRNADSTRLAWLYKTKSSAQMTVGRLADRIRSSVLAHRFASAAPADHRLHFAINAGRGFQRAEEFEVAMTYFDEAYRIAMDLDLDDPWQARGYGDAIYSRAECLSAMRSALRIDVGDFDELTSQLQDATAAFLRHDFWNDVGYNYLLMASLSKKFGRPEEAEPYLDQAYEYVRKAGVDRLTANYYLDRGGHYLETGRPDEAIAAYEKARAVSENSRVSELVRRSLHRLGRAYHAAGRLDDAISVLEEAVAEVERQGASLGGAEWTIAAFSGWIAPYRLLALMRLEQGMTAEAFLTLERGRARFMHEARRQARRAGQLPDASLAELQRIDEALLDIRTRLGGDRSNPEREELRRREMALVTEREALFEVSDGVPAVELSAVQSALRQRGGALVAYVLSDEEGLISHAIVLDGSRLQQVPIALTRDGAAERVREVMDEMAGSGGYQVDLNALHGLYETLFAPVAERIPEGKPLVIVPDGLLFALPFQMLVMEPPQRKDYGAAMYLLRRHPISYEMAAGLLALPREPGMFNRDILALGRSTYAPSGAGLDGSASVVLPDLPRVEDEIDHLRRRFRSGYFAVNEGASAAALLEMLPDSRVVHLATHGVVNTQSPLFSYLSLYPGEDQPEAEQEPFYFFRLSGRTIDADLVVLSACETARGEYYEGEGMLGLQYAFRVAGAGATLSTNWQVEDDAMALKMERFYTHLHRGKSRDRALQQAQLDYLSNAGGIAASPFFWAAPVLYGETDPLQFSSRARPAQAILLLLFLLAGAALGMRGIRQRRLAAHTAQILSRKADESFS